jgi:hypothetical protein
MAWINLLSFLWDSVLSKVVDKADVRGCESWVNRFSPASANDLLAGCPDSTPSLGVNAIDKSLQGHRSSGHATGGH